MRNDLKIKVGCFCKSILTGCILTSCLCLFCANRKPFSLLNDKISFEFYFASTSSEKNYFTSSQHLRTASSEQRAPSKFFPSRNLFLSFFLFHTLLIDCACSLTDTFTKILSQTKQKKTQFHLQNFYRSTQF